MEWISVEEMLPDNDSEVLLYNKDWKMPWNNLGIRIGFFQMTFRNFINADWIEEHDSYCNDYSQPTHWLPLSNISKTD